MSKSINLQDMILNNARKDNIPVTLYLISGLRFKGLIKGFDNFVVIIDVSGVKQMIYKHAISTIVPEDSKVFYNETNEQIES